jgi:hypothetical protein
MNKLRPLLFIAIIITLFSCEKEYSQEDGGINDDLIVGADCRLSKILYTDTAAKMNLGSIAAVINNMDIVTNISRFDSVSNSPEFISAPVYTNDSIYIDADQYFVVDVNKRIIKLHGLLDPVDPFSLQFDVFYLYNTAGYLVTKNYFLTISPFLPYQQINYIYSGGNLVRMEGIDKASDELFIDADIDYYSNITPRRFIYLFPDEKSYSDLTQFFNFGLKNLNAVKKLKVRNYDPGNVVRDSAVSNFTNYLISKDNYVLSVQMDSTSQQSIPALAGKLTFSYHCK